MSLKLPAFYLYCAGQLVYYVRGEFEESLSIFPLPLRSHYCVMVTVLANRPVPPISFPSYITTALLGIGEISLSVTAAQPVPANVNKAKR